MCDMFQSRLSGFFYYGTMEIVSRAWTGVLWFQSRLSGFFYYGKKIVARDLNIGLGVSIPVIGIFLLWLPQVAS